MFSPVALRPNVGHGLFTLEVSRSHITPQHSRQDSFELVISSSQRQYTTLTRDRILAPGGNRTHILFLFVINFAWNLVCRSESCVVIISFSVLLSDHTRQSYESVLFTNTVYTASILQVHYYAFPVLRTLLIVLLCVVCFPPFFWQYFHLFGFIRLQLLSFFNR